MRHDVFIDGRSYTMSDGVDIDALKEELLAAARAGGAFVYFLRERAISTEVMVTSSTSVRIDHTSMADDDIAAPLLEADLGDPDWWL